MDLWDEKKQNNTRIYFGRIYLFFGRRSYYVQLFDKQQTKVNEMINTTNQTMQPTCFFLANEVCGLKSILKLKSLQATNSLLFSSSPRNQLTAMDQTRSNNKSLGNSAELSFVG